MVRRTARRIIVLVVLCCLVLPQGVALASHGPSLLPEVDPGVIYTKPSATKVAEHGGFSRDDRHVPLIVVLPGGKPSTIAAPVETRAVAVADRSGASRVGRRR